MYEALLERQINLNPGTTKQDWAVLEDIPTFINKSEGHEDVMVFISKLRKKLKKSGLISSLCWIPNRGGSLEQLSLIVFKNEEARNNFNPIEDVNWDLDQPQIKRNAGIIFHVSIDVNETRQVDLSKMTEIEILIDIFSLLYRKWKK